MYFYMKYKYYFFSINVVHFLQGSSVPITYVFEHYHLWMMDSKAQNVCSTLTSAPVIILSLVRLFQL